MQHTGSTNRGLLGTAFVLTLLALCGATPASATIYQFAIPVTAVEAMFPAGFAAFDIYIRATANNGSDCLFGCTFLPNPYNVSGTPPAAPQAWTDVVNGKNTDNDGVVGPGDFAPYQSIRFTYGASPTISVIVKNSNSPGGIVGNTVNLKTVGGVVPNSSQFVVNISSTAANLAGSNFSIFIFGIGDQFSSNYIGASSAKGATFHGNYSATAELTPEPMSVFMGGGGLILLAIAGRRRRRQTR